MSQIFCANATHFVALSLMKGIATRSAKTNKIVRRNTMLEIENELSSEERQLVDAIQERINDTNAIQLIKYREIGKLIDDAYGDQKDYGSSKMDKIAKLVGKSPKTLYGYWKFYKDFDKNRIEILARQKFPIRYTLLRVYGSIGADKFMEIYEEATSLNDFKAKVRAQWSERK